MEARDARTEVDVDDCGSADAPGRRSKEFTCEEGNGQRTGAGAGTEERPIEHDWPRGAGVAEATPALHQFHPRIRPWHLRALAATKRYNPRNEKRCLDEALEANVSPCDPRRGAGQANACRPSEPGGGADISTRRPNWGNSRARPGASDDSQSFVHFKR